MLTIKITERGKLSVTGGKYPVLSSSRGDGDRKLIFLLPETGKIVWSVLYDGGPSWHVVTDDATMEFKYGESWKYAVPREARIAILT